MVVQRSRLMTPPDTTAVPTRTLIGVALLSGALLMTELSLTRIFSVTMFYHFAFLAISIALFGLSASGVYVYLSRQRLAPVATPVLLARQSLAYAAVTLLCLPVLLHMPVMPYYTSDSLSRLVAIYVVAALPFFAGGAAVTVAMSRLSAQISRVYAADLLRAGAPGVGLMPILNRFGAPGAIVISAFMGVGSAVLFAAAPDRRRIAALGGALGAVAIVAGMTVHAFSLGAVKGHEHYTTLFSKWNSFSRIA